jgi:hypothetical protein
MTAPVLPPVGPDLRIWGKNLTAYLRRTADKIRFKKSGDSPAEDGVFLWDADSGYPVVSLSGEFRQLIIANGFAQFGQDNDITAAAISTAYSIVYDAAPWADGVARDGTNPERIVFEEAGIYLLSFTAQISSTSSSTVTFRFWPRINGTDASGSTIVAKLHQNDASTVVSRSALFQVAAGDYLEVMWATSSTSGFLKAEPATAYAPAAPSTTLGVTRIRA